MSDPREARAMAFREACALIKESGSSPYHHYTFTLELARWLLADAEPVVVGSDTEQTTGEG